MAFQQQSSSSLPTARGFRVLPVQVLFALFTLQFSDERSRFGVRMVASTMTHDHEAVYDRTDSREPPEFKESASFKQEDEQIGDIFSTWSSQRQRWRQNEREQHRYLSRTGNGEAEGEEDDFAGGDTGRFELCRTRNPNLCDRLLMRNAYDNFVRKRSRAIRAANGSSPIFNFTIKVDFHQLLPEDAPSSGRDWRGRLSDNNIHQMLHRLNRAFNDTSFNFEFNQQTRTYNDTYAICDEEHSFQRETHTGGNRRLNVWLCDTRRQDYVGKSSYPNTVDRFPRRDGVILMNDRISRSRHDIPKNTLRWNLPHQVGHWLGLIHPWAGGCHNHIEDRDTPTRKAKGDGVLDTPPQSRHHWNTHGRYDCWQKRETNNNPVNSCDSPGLDDVNNYMNFIPFYCMRDHGHFTDDQKDRLLANYLEYRRGDKGDDTDFVPLRGDIIDVCLNHAIRNCGCDEECLQTAASDAREYVSISASREILEGPE